MKHLILFLYLCMFSFLNITYAQCTCSISSGTAQYPLTTLTPTTNWASQADIWAGDYTLFNVVSGNTYTWSYCSLDGGSSTWDTRLNLYRESNSTYITCSGDYDVSTCGNAAKIVWTADFNGVVRLITNVYINSSNQCGANTTGAKLRYKLSVQSLPDLIVEEFPTLSNSVVSVGGSTIVYFKVMNQGTANAGSSVTSIHISSKSWYDGTATYVDEYATSSISMGSNSGSKSKSITLPSSITPGNYYILVSADGGPPYPGGAVSESNENNQTTYVAITVQSTCIYSISPTSQNFPASGGSGSFDVNTQQNCSWSATTNENWIFTVSSNTGSGKVDYSVLTNSSNNSLTGYITVGGKTFTIRQDAAPLLKADLTLSNVSASPNPVVQGHPTIVTCKMKNVGLASAQNVTVSYLLSNNCTTNTLNDYFLGSSSPGFDLSALTGEVTVQTAVHIPVDASWVGTKYIKCWIDFSDNVIETNNDNNIFCTQITINAPMGQEFKLNETLLTDTSIISHLRWPFGRSSSWDSRNGFIGGSEFNGNPKGHGEKGHSLGEYYADDWTNQTAKSCLAPNENDSFYAPIEGKVIYINLWNICTNGCNPIPGDTCGNGFGNNIVIQSTVKPEFAFRVSHLKNINQTIINKYWSKQKVEIGEYLGCIGSTGNSDGPHAHCVLYQNIYSKDTIGGVPNIQAYGRLIAGLSAGINFNAPFYPNKFAANYKFDATWGGITGSGGPTGFGASLEQQTFSVFPNPNKGSFTVHFETLDAEQMDFYIYNLIGEKLYSESFQSRIGSNERAYQLNNLPGGIYTILLNSDNLSIRSKMIITN